MDDIKQDRLFLNLNHITHSRVLEIMEFYDIGSRGHMVNIIINKHHQQLFGTQQEANNDE